MIKCTISRSRITEISDKITIVFCAETIAELNFTYYFVTFIRTDEKVWLDKIDCTQKTWPAETRQITLKKLSPNRRQVFCVSQPITDFKKGEKKHRDREKQATHLLDTN